VWNRRSDPTPAGTNKEGGRGNIVATLAAPDAFDVSANARYLDVPDGGRSWAPVYEVEGLVGEISPAPREYCGRASSSGAQRGDSLLRDVPESLGVVSVEGVGGDAVAAVAFGSRGDRLSFLAVLEVAAADPLQ
jgi:hypothetical protein